ncbi:hypothetical protein M899_1483 [Bacteriovorax sp. BSW11_IV]|nr:hypothetical protein M899_1483 [Bacteriovorax sp. BSW11_IV]
MKLYTLDGATKPMNKGPRASLSKNVSHCFDTTVEDFIT